MPGIIGNSVLIPSQKKKKKIEGLSRKLKLATQTAIFKTKHSKVTKEIPA